MKETRFLEETWFLSLDTFANVILSGAKNLRSRGGDASLRSA
jgi:hypothetical protein